MIFPFAFLLSLILPIYSQPEITSDVTSASSIPISFYADTLQLGTDEYFLAIRGYEVDMNGFHTTDISDPTGPFLGTGIILEPTGANQVYTGQLPEMQYNTN